MNSDGTEQHRLIEEPLNTSAVASWHPDKLSVLILEANKGLGQISELMEQGQIKPVIDGPNESEKIPELIQYFGEGKYQRKIVVEINK